MFKVSARSDTLEIVSSTAVCFIISSLQSHKLNEVVLSTAGLRLDLENIALSSKAER